jgi:hypothetical protein
MTLRRRTALVAVIALAACKAKHLPAPEPVASVEPVPVAPPVATTPPVATVLTTADAKPAAPITVAPFTSPATTGIGARGALELRSNGTVLFAGKEYAKFDGDKIVDLGGSTIVRVASDGTLEGDLTPSGQRFVGDELHRTADVKLTVGKDGALTSTVSGKKTLIAKVHGGQSAKRAVILVFVLRERQDKIAERAARAAAESDLNAPCIPDPTKAPGNCLVTPTTEAPPEPPPAPDKRPKKR